MRKPFSLSQASRRWWVVLLVLLAATVWTYAKSGTGPATASRFGGPAQGTTYSVVLGHAESDSAVAALKQSVDSLLAHIDALMSTYDANSELSRLNRDTSGAPFVLSPHLARVLQLSAEVSQASGGAFDVTVGPLVDAWGFGVSGEVPHAPDSAALARLHARIGWQKLQLSPTENVTGAAASTSAIKTHPHLEVDLSAVAPGYSVDLISDLLTRRGAGDHLVEVGGEVRARGVNAQDQPFRVGIEEPDTSTRRVRLVVGLNNRALATSGNYRDNRVLDGVRYTHILDPRTGVPVKHALLSVSVLHRECAYADAWATALFTVGPERAWALAEANGLDVLLLVAKADGQVEERVTDGFRLTVMQDVDAKAVDRTTRRSRSRSSPN